MELSFIILEGWKSDKKLESNVQRYQQIKDGQLQGRALRRGALKIFDLIPIPGLGAVRLQDAKKSRL